MANRSLWMAALPASFAVALAGPAASGILIQGVIDGDLPGGLPKAIVLQATSAETLSNFSVGTSFNGSNTATSQFTLSGTADAGDTILVVVDATSQDFFTNNFATDFVIFTAFTPANINGDDVVNLFQGAAVIDRFGLLGVDGTGQPWEYLDGYAVRTGGRADPTFSNASNYSVNKGALDTLTEQQQADVLATAFGWTVPEPGSLALLALSGLTLARRRR